MWGELQTFDVAGPFGVHRNFSAEVWAQQHFCSGQLSAEYTKGPTGEDPNWARRVGVGVGSGEPLAQLRGGCVLTPWKERAGPWIQVHVCRWGD